MSNPRATIEERPECATFITPSMSTTSISRLPTEVLGYIFEQYVVHLAKSPWNLVLVSRQWKEIALAAPYLWSNVIVTSSTRHNDLYGIGGEIITQANFQVCRTLGELDLALVRSGATLLNIVIDYRYQDIENPMSDVMLARVIAKPVNDRLQKLYVSIREPTSFEPEQITKYIEHRYSSLIAIDIDVPDSWYQVLVSPLLKAKNRLQSIRTQIPDDIDDYTLNWDRIQSLDLENTPAPIFNRFCHTLQNLRILEGIPNDWPDTSTPLTILTQIPDLTLVGRSPRYPYNLSCLSLPNLRELYLCFFKLFTGDTVTHEDKASFFWSLPSLVRLSLDVHVPGILSWLSSVDTPNLERLSITSWIEDETDHFPSSIVFPNLCHLSIQTDYGSGDYYIGALEAAPNVSEAILLSRSNINPEQRGSTLLARLSETGARTLCPRLTKVTIDGGFSGLIGARKIFDPIIKRVVASRITQLKSFMVTWADDETRYIPLSVDYVEQLSQ
ncbi:hypothetical protein FRC17_001633 [Serendipita sp. 399]|nr:hypothetical protein FRC17_001633 [Serendipita sp. 399]